MKSLRERLLASLSTQFNNEAENAISRMKEGVRPYTRFVRAEVERVDHAQKVLAGLRQRVSALRARSQTL